MKYIKIREMFLSMGYFCHGNAIFLVKVIWCGEDAQQVLAYFSYFFGKMTYV